MNFKKIDKGTFCAHIRIYFILWLSSLGQKGPRSVKTWPGRSQNWGVLIILRYPLYLPLVGTDTERVVAQILGEDSACLRKAGTVYGIVMMSGGTEMTQGQSSSPRPRQVVRTDLGLNIRMMTLSHSVTFPGLIHTSSSHNWEISITHQQGYPGNDRRLPTATVRGTVWLSTIRDLVPMMHCPVS